MLLATNHSIPIFHFLSLLLCCVVLCFVLFCKIKEKELSVLSLSLSLSLSSLSPLTTRHKSNFVLCNPWYCLKLFRSSEQFHWIWNLHLVATKSTNTHTTHPTHICLCLVVIQSCCMLQSSNPIGAPFLFGFCFVLFYTLHSTHSPIHPHPPTHLLLPCTFFGWTRMRKHNQSWLAGWLFQGAGGGRVHMFFAFQKSWKKKVRCCSSTSSFVSQKCRRCSNNIIH